MCDYISGDLIICFPKVDVAARRLMEDIRRGSIEHVSHEESLEQKLAKLGLSQDEDIEFEFHRVTVPPGEEQWKITYLQFFYKHKFIEVLGQGQALPDFLDGIRRSDYQFTVVPNSVLSLAAKPLSKAAVKAANFTFSQFHAQYKTTVNVPATPPPELDQVRITIADSGIADDVSFPIVEKRNFVDPNQPEKVTDEIGHGTVIALILHELAPAAQLTVYKVADANGRVSEWDTLASLSVCASANIVNLSLQFGLEDRVCRICGRESRSSRSAVFENIIRQFAKREHKSILVVAAGNYGLGELAFPARFSEVLAIGAINSKGALSNESNYGDQYITPGMPDNHFVCPGGDHRAVPPETVGSFGPNDSLRWHGTSFAAAYATGVLANLMAQQDEEDNKYAAILDKLRAEADSETLVAYDSKKYGHGIMRISK
jgi:subtilisin family serine protease